MCHKSCRSREKLPPLMFIVLFVAFGEKLFSITTVFRGLKDVGLNIKMVVVYDSIVVMEMLKVH